MNAKDPLAFLSYVRADDDHERGRITALRQRLEGEVRMQTGLPFSIFQDKKDILWGQQWRERLDTELFNVTFLIPIVTPGYFRSTACREEFEKFLIREKQLGQNTLILPIYYLESDQIEESKENMDPMAAALTQRNWADWREQRFKSIEDPEVEQSIALMARTIKKCMKALEAQILASEAKPAPPKISFPSTMPPVDLAKFSPDVPELRMSGGKTKVTSAKLRSSYYAYTKEFDEVVSAGDLIDADSGIGLQARADRARRSLKEANEAPLTLAATALHNLKLVELPSIVFLVDNSGSLRDKGQMADIAGWLQILVEHLDAISIPTEILGFTTRAWKGGQSREKWLADGKPPMPGRLNDLRHIVYKSFNDKPDSITENMGLMASGRLLKENIDGEALLWAFDRVQGHGSPRSIIVMISDGAPVDDSTLASNPPNILEKHLLSTIRWLSSMEGIRLYGVGINYNTERYYPDGLSAIDPKTVGLEILKALPNWLEARAT